VISSLSVSPILLDMAEKGSPDLGLESTDLQRWRLDSNEGVHHWKYLNEHEATQKQQSFAERYLLGLPTVYPHPYTSDCRIQLTNYRTPPISPAQSPLPTSHATATPSSNSFRFQTAIGLVTMADRASSRPGSSLLCMLQAWKYQLNGALR
jgi:hypothetical protein